MDRSLQVDLAHLVGKAKRLKGKRRTTSIGLKGGEKDSGGGGQRKRKSDGNTHEITLKGEDAQGDTRESAKIS